MIGLSTSYPMILVNDVALVILLFKIDVKYKKIDKNVFFSSSSKINFEDFITDYDRSRKYLQIEFETLSVK